jgi:hypothetical protein
MDEDRRSDLRAARSAIRRREQVGEYTRAPVGAVTRHVAARPTLKRLIA